MSDQREEKARFWVEFQTVHDGMEMGDGAAGAAGFSCFAALPAELRLHVWEQLIQPRVVLAACFDSSLVGQKERLAQRPRRRAVPVLLHVNRESRALALRHYEPAFSWKLPHRLAGPDTSVLPYSREVRVWFNFRLDALLLLGPHNLYDRYHAWPVIDFLCREDARRVRHVACTFEGPYMSHYYSGYSLLGIMDRFPAAERLLITTAPQDLDARYLMMPPADSVVQKLWLAFRNNVTCLISLANLQILMIRERDLPDFIAGKD